MYSSSRVQLCGKSAHSCGYCKREDDTSVSYGVLSSNMTVDDYQSLLFIGWRRSGTYFYKPTMHKTCCPQYTIRLSVNNFKPTKSQRKVAKIMAKLEVHDNQRSTSKEKAPLMSNNKCTARELTTSGATIRMAMEKSSFTNEKFALYKKYQTVIHNDKASDVTEKSFRRFLVHSPLQYRFATVNKNDKEGNECPERLEYGSFHQLYRLGGQLIAVGVVDVLPTGLSSVYVFYDPDMKHLALGKYTALKEIEYCQTHCLEYYYMGFYIHSCDKMRYKSEYQPSELLCPTTLQWFLYSQCVPLLNKFNFTPFEQGWASRRAALDSVATSTSGSSTVAQNYTRKCVEASSDNKDSAIDDKNYSSVKGIVATTVSSVISTTDCTCAGARSVASGAGDDSNSNNSSSESSAKFNQPSITAELRAMLISQSDDQALMQNLEQFEPILPVATAPVCTSSVITGQTIKEARSNSYAEAVPMDIGGPRCVYLKQLQVADIERLKPHLAEWATNAGPDLAAKIPVLLT